MITHSPLGWPLPTRNGNHTLGHNILSCPCITSICATSHLLPSIPIHTIPISPHTQWSHLKFSSLTSLPNTSLGIVFIHSLNIMSIFSCVCVKTPRNVLFFLWMSDRSFFYCISSIRNIFFQTNSYMNKEWANSERWHSLCMLWNLVICEGHVE